MSLNCYAITQPRLGLCRRPVSEDAGGVFKLGDRAEGPKVLGEDLVGIPDLVAEATRLCLTLLLR